MLQPDAMLQPNQTLASALYLGFSTIFRVWGIGFRFNGGAAGSGSSQCAAGSGPMSYRIQIQIQIQPLMN